MDWLEVRRGEAPLIVSFPHTGTDIPADIEAQLTSSWLARKDADWWIHRLYDFASDLGATTVRTTVSRSVIDVNRDPSGASLYPGQATTELCPTTTFDGEPLYRDDPPDETEIARRRAAWVAPEPRYARGWGYLFQRHVSQANDGCDFDFLTRSFGPAAAEPEIF